MLWTVPLFHYPSNFPSLFQELAILEEEHKRMAAEEKKNDVTKKHDMTDFYRNILSQRTADVASVVAKEKKETAEETKPSVVPEKTEEPQEPTPKPVIKKVRVDQRRTYRARATSGPAQCDSTDSGQSSDEGSDTAEPSEVKPSEPSEVKPSEPSEDATPKPNDSFVAPNDLDKDDSDSSDSGEEDTKPKEVKDKEEEEPKEETKEEEEERILTEAEEKEERMKLIRESFKRRNTEITIQSATERYWKRKSELSVTVSWTIRIIKI